MASVITCFFPRFFQTLYKADFSQLSLPVVGTSALLSVLLFCGFLLALWPYLKKRGVRPAAYSSVFQTASRWNGFMALAIADKLFGSEGLATVAFVMAMIIIPLNVINVAVLVWHGGKARDPLTLGKRIISNPLIIACLAGLIMRQMPFSLYQPVEEAIGIVAQAALPMGMIMVGAGLIIRDTVRPSALALFSVMLKLVGFPIVMLVVALAAGAEGTTLQLLALCATVPTAMNGYVLARQMGGDATLYATVTTLQTTASFITIPLVLAVAARLGG